MATPSYVLTLRLKTESFQEDILNKRFEISRKMYNACLNELYKRYRTMKQSKAFQKAKKMKKGTGIEAKNGRSTGKEDIANMSFFMEIKLKREE